VRPLPHLPALPCAAFLSYFFCVLTATLTRAHDQDGHDQGRDVDVHGLRSSRVQAIPCHVRHRRNRLPPRPWYSSSRSLSVSFPLLLLQHSTPVCSSLLVCRPGPEQVLGNLLRGDLSTPSVQLSDGKSGSFFYYRYHPNRSRPTKLTHDVHTHSLTLPLCAAWAEVTMAGSSSRPSRWTSARRCSKSCRATTRYVCACVAVAHVVG
jgi:hypothetical protein